MQAFFLFPFQTVKMSMWDEVSYSFKLQKTSSICFCFILPRAPQQAEFHQCRKKWCMSPLFVIVNLWNGFLVWLKITWMWLLPYLTLQSPVMQTVVLPFYCPATVLFVGWWLKALVLLQEGLIKYLLDGPWLWHNRKEHLSSRHTYDALERKDLWCVSVCVECVHYTCISVKYIFTIFPYG